MCDYSLQNVKSRKAQVGDKLTTKNFGTGTRGFAASEDPSTAVCLLPGTEIAFIKPVQMTNSVCGVAVNTGHKTAIFRQVNKDKPNTHHDTLEFPDGEKTLLTYLVEGQEASVLQLPAPPKTAKEADEQRRAEYAG